MAVLIEINIGGETAKTGVVPDSPELEELLLAAPRLEALEFRGLMTVPPFTERSRRCAPLLSSFANCANCAMPSRRANFLAVVMDVLSMGMSHDFEVAIEEGSTCVRVGTAIFGERSKA